jgi:hypothetical protein
MRFVILICFTCFAVSLHSQYRKIPFDTAARWVEKNESHLSPDPNQFSVCYGTLKVNKDSMYNSKVYHYIRNIGGCNFTSALLREDTLLKRVMILVPPNEYILYNFNKNTGDTALLYSNYNMMNTLLTFTVTSKDSILLADGYHRRSVLNAGNSYTVIEGVGGLSGITTPYGVTFEIFYTLMCMRSNYSPSSTVYHYMGNGNSCSESIITPVSKNIENPRPKLFPLPAADIVTLENEMQNIRFEINDVYGNILPTPEVKTLNTEYQVNVSSLPSGIYFLNILYQEKKFTSKLVIQR